MSLTAKRLPLLLAGLIVSCLLLLPSVAHAASSKYPKVAVANFPAGTVKKTFKVPLAIKPGQNLNLLLLLPKRTLAGASGAN
jgi:hypothetical protein